MVHVMLGEKAAVLIQNGELGVVLAQS